MGILLSKEMISVLWATIDAGGEVEIDGEFRIRTRAKYEVNKSHWNGGDGSGGYTPNEKPDRDTMHHGPDGPSGRIDSPRHDEFMDALEPIPGPGANLVTVPGGRIEVNRDDPKGWETFKFYKAPDGRVAIKSHVGHFSCRDSQIVANAETVTETEMWRVLGNPDGTVTIQGSNGGCLIGNHVTVTLWLNVPLFPPQEWTFTFDETAFVLTPKPDAGRGCFALMTNRKKYVSVQPQP